MLTSTQSNLLKLSAILWVIWGFVHMFAGVMTIGQDTPQAIAGIADAVDPALVMADYHPAAGAIINQHGFNLLWIGLVTLIGGIFIWRQNFTAIWVTGMIGGITDIGYFIYIDLGGFANFVPGTVMTIISATAVLTSFYVWLTAKPAK